METYFHNMTAEEGSGKKLAQDLRELAYDMEVMMKTSAGQLSDEAKSELTSVLAKLKSTSHKLEQEAAIGVRAIDKIIRKNPYPPIGIALTAGILLGVLIGRKD